MKAKITCIYDEGSMEGTSLIGAKGLCLMVDVDGQRTFFGVGLRGRYLSHNMSILDIEADSVDRVVISHGHPDHFGALDTLLKERTKPVDIFAPVEAWAEEKKIIGSGGIFIPLELIDNAVTHDVTEWTELSEHLLISKPLGSSECFLLLRTKIGPIVISGCSHFGVDNAIEAVRERTNVPPKGYIGGVHIPKGKKGNLMADAIAASFNSVNCTELHLNHCSENGMGRLRFDLGLKAVNDFYVGQELEFEV